MKIFRFEDVAILLMSELYKSGNKFITLREIASRHGLSFIYLKKIAHSLKLKGLIISKEGLSGGYKLAKSANKISIFDIVNSVSSNYLEINSKICPIKKNCIPFKIRNILNNSMKKSLSKILLTQLN